MLPWTTSLSKLAAEARSIDRIAVERLRVVAVDRERAGRTAGEHDAAVGDVAGERAAAAELAEKADDDVICHHLRRRRASECPARRMGTDDDRVGDFEPAAV